MSAMIREADNLDARLLDLLQKNVPLVDRPYALIAEQLGAAEADVIDCITRLREAGVIRQISAIFDSASLGYTSSLVAFAVCQDRLDEVAQSVAALTSVSHCYSRDHRLNLWFTVTVPPGQTVSRAVEPLSAFDGVQRSLVLPSTRVFKVNVFLKMADEEHSQAAPLLASGSGAIDLSPQDIAAIRALQRDLPVVARPFDILSIDAGMTVEDLLARGRRFAELGAMRRFAAVLRHRRAGYVANAMLCWLVDAARCEEIGQALASHPAVSHCYQRRTYTHWPYSLYTMLHARTDDQLAGRISELEALAPGVEFTILTTLKEYKKSRVQYFVD